MIATDISVDIDSDFLYLEVEGKEYKFPIAKISQRLLKATLAERKNFQISPSGYGIHWPMIDEDLSIPALIKSVEK
ncbi:MAG: DUF2442 domain-containing protein [Chitinophagales bacterium]|nr:DUF2442 domain-containing protein [Chitinophagales bacterium]